MNKAIKALLIVLILIFLGAYAAGFEVQEGTVAVAPDQQILQPGLHWKWPWQKTVTLTTAYQTFTMQTTNSQWLVVAHLASPAAYWQNSKNQSVNDLIAQAWSEATANSTSGVAAQPVQVQTAVLALLQQNALLAKNGVAIDAVIFKGLTLSDADQAAILQNMQGVAGQIAQNVLSSGEAEAQQIRANAQANYLATQAEALSVSAKVMGASQAQAVKLLVPMYQKNPALFKAYVQAQAEQIHNSHS